MAARTAIIVICLSCLLWVDTAYSGSGQVITLPLPNQKIRSGLKMTIDPRWVDGSGYRPIRVRIAPIVGGVAPADRYIDVKIRPRGWYQGHKAGAATGTVYLAQGAAYGEAVIDIPQTNAWSRFDVDAYEDNRELIDLEARNISQVMRYYYDNTDGTPSILILHRMAPDWSGLVRVPNYTGAPNETLAIVPSPSVVAGGLTIQPMLAPKVLIVGQGSLGKELTFFPDIRVLASRFPMTYYNNYISADRLFSNAPATDAETMRLVNELPYLDIVNPRGLPDRWLSYSGVDVIMVSRSDLQWMVAEFPEKWEAIRTWLATGTTLCVYDAARERMPELNKLLGLDNGSDPKGSKEHGWSKPDPKNFTSEIITFRNIYGSNPWWLQQANNQRQVISSEPIKTLQVAMDPPPLLLRTVGQGQLVAIAASNPFPGTEYDWNFLFNSVPAKSWMWSQRHGISMQRENQNYWNFLLPDIGRAPVLSFLALITVFAVVIGPLNYYVLRRRRQLFLMVVTVPLGALLVTGSLFTYATLADGLGVRVRVRSYTEIDQRHGQAVSWSRQSYYAGLAPSRGLVYSSNAATYPVDYRPNSNFGVEDTSRHIMWAGDEQILASGYFLSRTAAQLVVVEPQETTAGIQVMEKDAGPPQVVNRLDTSVSKILLRDARGDLFTMKNLKPNAESVLQAADLEAEVRFFRNLYGANRLRYPPGFNPAQLENVTGIFGNGYYYGESMPVTVDTSVLESMLRTRLSSDFTWMQPRTYLAVTERPPLVSLGVESAAETASFHVIVGRW